ncbi:hypothetical protein M8494_26495 [Serratia ureilytica]
MSPDTARISEIIDRARISPYQILILTPVFPDRPAGRLRYRHHRLYRPGAARRVGPAALAALPAFGAGCSAC